MKTHNGYKYRIINLNDRHPVYPVSGVVKVDGEEIPMSWTHNGVNDLHRDTGFDIYAGNMRRAVS